MAVIRRVVVLVLVVVTTSVVVAQQTTNMGYNQEVSLARFCEGFLMDLEYGKLNASPEQYVQAFRDAGYPFEDAHALVNFLGWAGVVKSLPQDSRFSVAYLEGDRIVWRNQMVRRGTWALRDGSEPFNWLILVPCGNVIKAQHPKVLPGPRVYLQAPTPQQSCGELESRIAELERVIAELRQAQEQATPLEDTAGAREQIVALEAEIGILKERLGALEGQGIQTTGRVEGVEQQLHELSAQVLALRQEVNLLAQGLDEVREEVKTILPLVEQSQQPAVVKKHHHRNEWLPWLLGAGVGYLVFHGHGGGHGCGGGGPAPLPPNGPALPPN